MPAERPTPTVAGAESPHHGQLVVAVLCCAQLVLSIDITVVNVASYHIERALGFTTANLQWTVTAYALTFGGFLLLGGRMADLYDKRRLFLASISGFALASLGAGVARSSAELIAARAAQGLFAAAVSPTVLSLLSSLFSEGRARQRALGVWATAASLGGLLGFLFGGVITSLLGWRWIFFINLPIVAAVLIGATILVPAAPPGQGRRRRLDVPGAATVTAGLALVIYGLGEGQSTSWSATPTLVGLSAAPVLLGVFVLVERRSAEPLLPFALLRRRAAVANALAVFQQSVGSSTAFLAPLFMQEVWAYPAARAGAATLPLPIGYGIAARVSSRLVGRVGPKRLILAGFCLIALGCAWLARAGQHDSYVEAFLAPLFIRSFGQGLVVVPVLVSVTSGVAREDQGIAAGLFNMAQQLGGALGLAALATVASAGALAHGGGVAGDAAGIRLGFAAATGIGLVAAAIAVVGLRSTRQPRQAERVECGASGPPLERVSPLGEGSDAQYAASIDHNPGEARGDVQ